MNRSSNGRQMKSGLGTSVEKNTTDPDASSEKLRTDRDKQVGGKEPNVMGSAMRGGDQTGSKGAVMGNSDFSPKAKNTQG